MQQNPFAARIEADVVLGEFIFRIYSYVYTKIISLRLFRTNGNTANEIRAFVFVAWKIDLAKIIIGLNSLFTDEICTVERRKNGSFYTN